MSTSSERKAMGATLAGYSLTINRLFRERAL